MKKNIKLLLPTATFLACFSVGLGISVGSAYEATTKLFEGNGVSIKTEQSYGGEKGTLLSATRSGAYAEYAETVSGIFSVRFSLPEAYGDEIAFTFSDATSEDEFTLSLQTGKETNEFFVSSDGKLAGLYYGSHGTTSGQTALMNGDGYYTRLNKGQFVSVAFDPNTMCVYADNVLVWDFLSEYNDGARFGKVMEGFSSYDVTVSFPKVAQNGAEILVYELLGQSLNEKYIKQDVSAPLIYADLKLNAVKKRAYEIPEPVVYDLGDGRIEKNKVRVVVSNAKGEKLVDENYTDGLSFAPQSAGKYKIAYSTSDASGNMGNTVFEISAFEIEPEFVFELSQSLESETVGAGTSVRLPSAIVKGDLYTANTSYVPYARVYAADNSLVFEATATENTIVTLTENGTYTIVYEYALRGLEMRKEMAVITVDDSLPTFSYAELNDEYVVGEVIKIPAVNVSVGGKTVEAEATVTFPNGSTYRLATLRLAESGVYTVTWRAEIDGERYVTSRTFFANLSPENVFVSGSGALNSAFADYAYDTTLSGLKVELVPDTAAVYSETVDFEKLGAGDTLVEFLAVSPVESSILYNKVYITLRDATDYSNYFTIFVDGNLSQTQSALTVRTANGSKFYGISANGAFTTSGYTSVRHSFSSTAIVGRTAAENTVEIRYDYKAGKLYVRDESGEFGLFADFSNELFTNVAGSFDGFKDGKAVIEISFSYLDSLEAVWYDQAYYYNSAELMLLQLAGYDFTGGKIEDGEKPQISVDLPTILPAAVVGKQYAIFSADAFDKICGRTEVGVRVVYNYGKSSYLDMQIENGTFTPIYEGEYTIVYTATDESGNVANYLVKINALKTNPTDLAIEIEDVEASKYYSGLPVALREITPSGGVGGVYYTSFKVTDPEGKEIPVADGAFVPDGAGIFTVTCTVMDYVGNAVSDSYQIGVEINDVPYFDEEVKIVPVMTAGRSATLPMLKALDYSSLPAQEIEPQVYVRYPGEEDFDATAIDINDFTPNPDRVIHGDELEFKYVWAGEASELVKSAKCLVAEIVTEDEYIDVSKYFIYKNVESELAASYLRLSASNGGRAVFGKKIIASGFNLSTALESNITSLLLTLTDVKDPTIAIKIKFYAAGGTYYLQVNNGAAYSIASVVANRTAEFSYNVSTQNISLKTNVTSSSGNTTLVEVKETAYGEPFYGFTGGFITAELDFAVSGIGVLNIYNIGNQNVSNEKEDYTGPAIWVQGEYMGTIRIGESFTIPKAIAEDILSYAGNVTVSVTTPDGKNYVVSEDGVTLAEAPAERDYSIRPTELGRYTINYACRDENGRKARFVSRPLYVIEATNHDALEIVLSDKMPTSAKINKALKLPTATSADGKTYNLLIAVYSPVGTPVTLSETGGFTPTVEGVYRIRYMLYDASERLAMQEYEIVVS